MNWRRPDITRVPFSKPDLLFDVDGVLVCPQLRFRDYLKRNHGITPEMTKAFFRGRFQACLTGNADLTAELSVHLEHWGWPGTVSSFIEAWLREDGTPDQGMLELVAELQRRGFNCHVASVQERNRARYLRHVIGFERLFSSTFFSCDLGVAKPDPAFYAKIQEQLAKPPEMLLLLDDSPVCVDAARDAGWQALHYSGPNAHPSLAAEIEQFSEFGPACE